MAENSAIEWCDHTYNPWPSRRRRRKAESARDEPKRWNRKAVDIEANSVCENDHRKANAVNGRDECGVCGDTVWSPAPRPRVFCGSLCDWLDPEVPAEWLADLLALIAATPHLDWLLLSKRPELWGERMGAVLDMQAPAGGYDPESKAHLATATRRNQAAIWLEHEPPTNVWIGVTVEDRQRADERIPALLEIPARVRFLSCEPLLERVRLPRLVRLKRRITSEIPVGPRPSAPAGDHLALGNAHGALAVRTPQGLLGIKPDEFDDLGLPIHWIIAGGESGPRARPCHPAWIRSLRDQCATAGVPFLFKQWGRWGPIDSDEKDRAARKLPAKILKHASGQSSEASVQEIVDTLFPFGLKASGRELDGREHLEFPA